MVSIPSIKGSAIAKLVEDVGKLISSGKLSKAEAAKWLKPEDVSLLDEDIVVSRWYDIRSYTRMTELLRDLEGGRSNEYVRERGRQTARRLLATGLYLQLEYLQRVQVARRQEERARFEAFGRDLRLLATISGSILSFSRWISKPEPELEGRYLIEVSDARDFPDVLCWSSDGFVNEMATQHGEPDLWSWERAGNDLIVFRMIRSL